jgi:hypothetical protein
VKVEGRLSALLDRDRTSYRLCSRDDLRQADASARSQLRELLGVAPAGDVVGLGRFDLTFEHVFEDPAAGHDLLQALGSLLAPAGYDRRTYDRDGQVSSVAYVTRKRSAPVARFYDKSLELAGKGIDTGEPPGTRIRLEAQNRRRGPERLPPAIVAGRDLRHEFGRTLAPVLKGGHDVTVRGSDAIVDELLGRVARDELTLARAERLIGSVEVLRRVGRAAYDERQGRRRLQALREAGVPLSSELPPDRIVPVGELLRQAVEEFAA